MPKRAASKSAAGSAPSAPGASTPGASVASRANGKITGNLKDLSFYEIDCYINPATHVTLREAVEKDVRARDNGGGVTTIKHS